MIPFDKKSPNEQTMIYVKQALESGHWTGDGPFTKACHKWFANQLGSDKILLTTSCTHALEMACFLSGIGKGDEVIMPSFTFVSTANPIVLRGAIPVFVDVDPATMNIDPKCIEKAITAKTKAIVPVHYGGISCDMDSIMAIAESNGLKVIEDAAQGVLSYYHDKPLGTIGDFGAFSFHGTKNYACGEGGMVLVKDRKTFERAEIMREKGTNRSQFLRGVVDKYTWIDQGSSYLPSDILSAVLLSQLEESQVIMDQRITIWNTYHETLEELENKGHISRPYIPEGCRHNGHLYYIKTKDLDERTDLMDFLKKREIATVYHYIPLHSAREGKKSGRFSGEDVYTTKDSERLLRLPLWQGLEKDDQMKVIEGIKDFYS